MSRNKEVVAVIVQPFGVGRWPFITYGNNAVKGIILREGKNVITYQVKWYHHTGEIYRRQRFNSLDEIVLPQGMKQMEMKCWNKCKKCNQVSILLMKTGECTDCNLKSIAGGASNESS